MDYGYEFRKPLNGKKIFIIILGISIPVLFIVAAVLVYVFLVLPYFPLIEAYDEYYDEDGNFIQVEYYVGYDYTLYYDKYVNYNTYYSTTIYHYGEMLYLHTEYDASKDYESVHSYYNCDTYSKFVVKELYDNYDYDSFELFMDDVIINIETKCDQYVTESYTSTDIDNVIVDINYGIDNRWSTVYYHTIDGEIQSNIYFSINENNLKLSYYDPTDSTYNGIERYYKCSIDPETKVKEIYDNSIYDFTIPESYKYFVQDVINAFDNECTYTGFVN